MPSEDRGRLRVESEGGWPVTEVIEFLDAFKYAHDDLLIFETILESYETETRRQRRYAAFPIDVSFGPANQPWLELSDQALMRLIRPQDQLVLHRVELTSPGFWEFLGSLNPLEVLRRYLDDRHRRRQDREYREPHERRRLELESLLLENQVLRERISFAREFGMTDQMLTPLLNRLAYEPLQRIEIVDSRGMISSRPDSVRLTPGESDG